MERVSLGAAIANRLSAEADRLAQQFDQPGRIRTFALDDLLEPATAQAIYESFPPVADMMLRKSLREHKYVATQMDRYPPILEEILFAFQEPAVVEAVGQIAKLDGLMPDSTLCAGGISAMTQGQYLNPHLDNSHDEGVHAYRMLNLLYYTTPGWDLSYGGNLQVWDHGPKGEPRTIESRFNRLVVLATSRRSWHSVDRIIHNGVRTCVSNYYFAARAVTNEGRPIEGDYFHPTTFRGFPDQPGRNAVLVADGMVRSGVRKVFHHGVKAPPSRSTSLPVGAERSPGSRSPRGDRH